MVLQKVDMLPWEKFDMFNNIVDRIAAMSETSPVSSCVSCNTVVASSGDTGAANTHVMGEKEKGDCEESDEEDVEISETIESDDDDINTDYMLEEELSIDRFVERIFTISDHECGWINCHKCVEGLKVNDSFDGLDFHEEEEDLQGTAFEQVTRRQREAVEIKKSRKEGVIEVAEERLQHFAKELVVELRETTYSEEDTRLIELTRTLTDMESFKKAIEEKGPVLFSVTYFPTYIDAVRQLPVKSLENVSDLQIRAQFDKFAHLIGDLDWGSKCDSRGFIKRLLSEESGESLYKGIELINHITTCAAVKLSTESVLESNVSVWERHFDKTRAAANESTMKAEVEIALNGPVLVEADEVIEEAINRYFKGKKWHFLRRDIRDYMKDSNALKRLKSARSRLPYSKMLKK